MGTRGRPEVECCHRSARAASFPRGNRAGVGHRGRVRCGLACATTDAFGAVLETRQELCAALVLPEGADVGLEVAAKEELAQRYGRREKLPEDPREEDSTTA